MKIVQYFVINGSILNTGWGPGAVAAQLCHATALSLVNFLDHEEVKIYLSKENLSNMTKIIVHLLKTKSEDEFESVIKQLQCHHVDHCIWTEKPEDIRTVVALRPTRKEMVQEWSDQGGNISAMDSEAGKIFVGGLHWNTTDDGLKAYFEQFGQVIDCHIMRDPSGKSRCFGFVNFSDPSIPDVVLQKTHILDGKQIDPKKAVPKNQQQQYSQPNQSQLRPLQSQHSSLSNSDESKIFVGGIHSAVEEAELKEFFSQFGNVVETILMRDRETNRSRGFGFVTFATPDSALKAHANHFLELRGRKMEIKLAVPKGKQQTAAPFVQGHQGPTTSYDPASYAAMTEYYRQMQMSAPVANIQNPSTYSDPKAYMDALVAAYTTTYGPEVAAQAASYYSQFLNAPGFSETNAIAAKSLSSDKNDNETDIAVGKETVNKHEIRKERDLTYSSTSGTESSRSQSKSPSRDYRRHEYKSSERRGHRRDRSLSRSKSRSPERERYSSREKDRRHKSRR